MKESKLRDTDREKTIGNQLSYQLDKAQRVAEEVGYGWMAQARCAGEDPELWQPSAKRTRDERIKNQKAAAMCFNECPVRLECLKAACLASEPVGIWGGLGYSTRRGEVHGFSAHDYDSLSKLTNPYE